MKTTYQSSPQVQLCYPALPKHLARGGQCLLHMGMAVGMGMGMGKGLHCVNSRGLDM